MSKSRKSGDAGKSEIKTSITVTVTHVQDAGHGRDVQTEESTSDTCERPDDDLHAGKETNINELQGLKGCQANINGSTYRVRRDSCTVLRDPPANYCQHHL